MADITMCKGTDGQNLPCPMREDCYRFTAKPNPFRQSYFMATPLVWMDTGGREFAKCDELWINDKLFGGL